jgi:hypothetical protein
VRIVGAEKFFFHYSAWFAKERENEWVDYRIKDDEALGLPGCHGG